MKVTSTKKPTAAVTPPTATQPVALEPREFLERLKTRLVREELFAQEWFDKFEARLDELEKSGQPIAKVLSRTFGCHAHELDDTLIDDLVKGEKHQRAIDEFVAREPKFYDTILIDWLKSNMFYLELSRWIRKRPAERFSDGRPNPTAAMLYNFETDDFEMLYNPRFFAGMVTKDKELGTRQVEGTTEHEFDHNIFRHIVERRRDPAIAWNIATDAAINSLITDHGGKLPEGGVIPGEKWLPPSMRGLTPEEKKIQEELSGLIESWPKLGASEWYFSSLMSHAAENGLEWTKKGIRKKRQPGEGAPGSGDPDLDAELEIEGIDSHDFWDQIPDEQREVVAAKLKEMIKKAVRKAAQTQNGWGNIPAELREQIKASVDDQIDWEALLRGFVGSFTRGSRRTSIKKINKKYPLIHPGVTRSYLPHIAVAIDQSGSVSDEWLEQFCGVLRSLAKKVSFTFIPFDYTVDEASIFEWKRQQTPELKRTRAGGTCFQAPIDYVNAPERRGKWDGLIVLTDGGCSKPDPGRLRTCWVLAPDTKLMFETDDLVVQMENPAKQVKKGAWR